MKPKWWPYRSSMWFQLMMLQAAIGIEDGICPFCIAFDCPSCPMARGADDCSMTRFATVYGLSWRAAYPDLVPPGSYETTEKLVDINFIEYYRDQPDCWNEDADEHAQNSAWFATESMQCI